MTQTFIYGLKKWSMCADRKSNHLHIRKTLVLLYSQRSLGDSHLQKKNHSAHWRWYNKKKFEDVRVSATL